MINIVFGMIRCDEGVGEHGIGGGGDVSVRSICAVSNLDPISVNY